MVGDGRIERLPIDSSNIKSVGYQGGVLVIEFHTGAIYAYRDVPAETWEAFGAASSRGQFYNQKIRHQFKGEKITGICPSCGSKPELIGELCRDCGTAIVLAEETRYENYDFEGAARVATELAAMKKLMVDDLPEPKKRSRRKVTR